MISGTHLEQIADAIRARRCVLFAGAGTSRDAGLPDWLDMAHRLKDSLVRQAKFPTEFIGTLEPLLKDKDSLPLAFEVMLGYVQRKDVAQALREILTPTKKSKVAEIVSELSLHGAITTNYDRVLDSVVSPQSYHLGNSLVDLKTVPTAVAYSGQFLLKLHGDIDNELAASDPKVAQGGPFMVLCNSDYSALVQSERGQLLMLALHSVLQENSVLFLGYSFSDPDVNWLLSYLAQYCQFAHTSWYVGLNGEPLPSLPQNVVPIRAIDDWVDLPTWLQKLANVAKKRLKVPVVSPGPSEEERRAFVALGQYLHDLESDDLPERVLACGLMDEIATKEVLPLGWLRDRIAPLLDVGPEMADALAEATARYLKELRLADSQPDGSLRTNKAAAETLRSRALGEWNRDRDRFYRSVARRLGIRDELLPPDFRDRLDRVLHECCMSFGVGMAKWVHRGIGEEFGWSSVAGITTRHFNDTDDIRKADAVLHFVSETPSDDEIPYLYRLLGAAFLANSVRLEPSSSEALKSILSSYELYLDSNVLLPLVIEEHPDHHSVAAIVRQSRNAGVKLFVLPEMLNEIEGHRRLALHTVRDSQGELAKLVTLVAVLGRRANCFVGGYLNGLRPSELEQETGNVRDASIRWDRYIAKYAYANLNALLEQYGITVVDGDPNLLSHPEYARVLQAINTEWKKRGRGHERPSVLNEDEARLFCHIYQRRGELAAEHKPAQVWFLSYETVLEKVFERDARRWGMPPTFPFSAWVAFLDSRLPWAHKDPGAVVRAILIGYSSAFDLPDPVSIVRKKAFGERVPTAVEENALQLATSGFELMKTFERARRSIMARSNVDTATLESAKALRAATGEIESILARDIDRLHAQLDQERARATDAEAELKRKQREIEDLKRPTGSPESPSGDKPKSPRKPRKRPPLHR